MNKDYFADESQSTTDNSNSGSNSGPVIDNGTHSVLSQDYNNNEVK